MTNPKEAELNDLRIDYLPLELLQVAAVNPKRHQLQGIAASIGRFGYAEPIVMDDRTSRLVAGHGRRESLLRMKDEGQAPPAGVRLEGDAWMVPVVRGWSSKSDSDAAAYLVASNRHVETGGWDDAELAQLLAQLGDLTGTGFEQTDLDALLAEVSGSDERHTDPDDAPDPPAESWVKLGDLFELGRHRLLCGDSTSSVDVARLMAGKQAVCMWTDPPYGVSYQGKTKGKLTIQNDGAEGLERLLTEAFAQANEALAPGSPIYIAHPAGAPSVTFGTCFLAAGWRLHETLIWKKDALVLGHSDYHFIHEPIILGYKPGPGRRGRGGQGWYGDDSQVSVIEVPRPKRSEKHPTMKPVELITRMLANSTKAGDLVLEPFSGSGSTLMACEVLGRTCRAVELDPRFIQAALERWEAHTGKKAKKLEA